MKKIIFLAVALFLSLQALSGVCKAADSEDESVLPAENDVFWQILAQLKRPDDPSCVIVAKDKAGMNDETALKFCAQTADIVNVLDEKMSNAGLFFSGSQTTNLKLELNWHEITNLTFDHPLGKLTFNGKIDLMSYKFMNLMNALDNMMKFGGAYFSLNAAMIPELSSFNPSLVMKNLDFDSDPVIYVNGKEATDEDIDDYKWDKLNGTLSFSPNHFSFFKAVKKGTKIKKIKIKKATNRVIKLNSEKGIFTVGVKGKNIRGKNRTCTIGFGTSIKAKTKGSYLICTFRMSDFNQKGKYPLTVSAPGLGDNTRQSYIALR